MTTWTPTKPQVEFVRILLAERVAESERDNWWFHIRREVTSLARFQDVISALKRRPKLPEFLSPSEIGLYRNPETGVLYRLTKTEDGHLLVSEYSKVALTKGLRLTTKGEVVRVEKGKWRRGTLEESKRALRVIRASWKMTEEEMREYQYGICLFCYRNLEDARSVYHMYGPKCAQKHGLPWNELPEGIKFVEEK